jgi:hypothetical protein
MIHLAIYRDKHCVLQRKRYHYKAPAFQPGSGQWSGDTCTMRGSGDGSIGKPLEVENGLVEPSPEAHSPEGLYIARTPIRDWWEVPVTVLNTSRRDQKLTKGLHPQEHATMWGYRRVRQHLVILHRSRQEERGPPLLRRLQESDLVHPGPSH